MIMMMMMIYENKPVQIDVGVIEIDDDSDLFVVDNTSDE